MGSIGLRAPWLTILILARIPFVRRHVVPWHGQPCSSRSVKPIAGGTQHTPAMVPKDLSKSTSAYPTAKHAVVITLWAL